MLKAKNNGITAAPPRLIRVLIASSALVCTGDSQAPKYLSLSSSAVASNTRTNQIDPIDELARIALESMDENKRKAAVAKLTEIVNELDYVSALVVVACYSENKAARLYAVEKLGSLLDALKLVEKYSEYEDSRTIAFEKRMQAETFPVLLIGRLLMQ